MNIFKIHINSKEIEYTTIYIIKRLFKKFKVVHVYPQVQSPQYPLLPY